MAGTGLSGGGAGEEDATGFGGPGIVIVGGVGPRTSHWVRTAPVGGDMVG